MEEKLVENGRFYAVGVGPGDPELMTVKAIKTIENADVIVIPTTEQKYYCYEDRSRIC